MKMRYLKHALAAILALSCVAGAALAGERHHRDNRWHGEIGRFHEHDLQRWSGGRWHHGHHHGRNGWWWIVGGVWYFYPARIAPYPDPYQPPVAVVPPPSEEPPQYWYYCTNPPGYYPYVARCAVNWERVPAAAEPR